MQNQDHHRQLEECEDGVIGFSVYDQSTNKFTLLDENNPYTDDLTARIMLESFPMKKINIVANVGVPCAGTKPIQCVKLRLGTWERFDSKLPYYSLYGDSITTPGQLRVRKPNVFGWQTLEAWTYTNKNCTQGESGYNKIRLSLVKKQTQTIRGGPVVAIYEGTNTTKVSYSDYLETSQVACNYIQEGFSYGFVYKGSLSTTKFICYPTKLNVTTPPVRIQYKVSVTFRISSELSYYINPDMPTSKEVTSFLKSLLVGQTTIGPGACDYLLDTMKNNILPSNPYYGTTVISLAA